MTRRWTALLCSAVLVFTQLPELRSSAADRETRYVLSENAFRSEDVLMYQDDFGIDLQTLKTGAEYTWDTQDQEIQFYDDYVSVDGSYRKTIGGQDLRSGNIRSWLVQDGGFPGETWSQWGYRDWETVRFDLKHSYPVDAVDLWDYNRGKDGTWAMGEIEIYAGNSRDQMDLVWSGMANQTTTQAEYDAGAYHYNRTPASFPKVSARYLDIRFKSAETLQAGENEYSCQQVRPVEIVIFGNLPYAKQQGELAAERQRAEDFLERGEYYQSTSALSEQVLCLNDAIGQETVTEEEKDALIAETERQIRALIPRGDYYTLSGNTWSEGDSSYYQIWDEQLMLKTAAENQPGYRWINTRTNLAGEEQDIYDYDFTDGNGTLQRSAKSNDPDCKALTNGYLANNDGNQNVNGAWCPKGPSVFEFDLGGIYPVDRLDMILKQYASVQQIQIFVSEDGEHYQKIAEQAGNTESSAQNADRVPLYFQSVRFAPTMARYLRVIPWNQGYQQDFCEAAVFGWLAPIERNPRAENVRFTDEADQTQTVYYGVDALYAAADVCDTSAELIAAVYSQEGRLKRVLRTNQEDYELGVPYSLKIKISPLEVGDQVRAFVITSLDRLTPLGKCADIRCIDGTAQGIISGNSVGADVSSYALCEGYDWVLNGETSQAFLQNGDTLFDGDRTALFEGEQMSIRLHFQNTVRVEKINLYAMCSPELAVGTVEVSASMDGISYEPVEGKLKIPSGKLNRIMPVSLDFSDVYARHLKITVKKSQDADGMGLSELEVYGHPAEFSKQRFTGYTYETAVPFRTEQDLLEADSSLDALNHSSDPVETAGNYASVIYDLGGYYQPEDVTVYGDFAGGEVLTSVDGFSYYQAAVLVLQNGKAHACGKANQNARYIKVVLHRGALSRIVLREIVVTGRSRYDRNAEKNSLAEPVSVKAELKANNILTLDWSGYPAEQNDVVEYKVYISDRVFGNTSRMDLKQVYVNGEQNRVSLVEGMTCRYAGLAPDQDYYVAVVPVMSDKRENTTVTPTKIHTGSQTGGETLAGLFCMNEYPNGGGAHQQHADENKNLQTKRKLISDTEVMSKTRYWLNSQSVFDLYGAVGFGAMQYAKEEQMQLLNQNGIYSFVHSNEPEIQNNDYYQSHPEEYYEQIKALYQTVKSFNEKNLLAEASICGTDKLAFIRSLYETAKAQNENFADYYDIFDVHAYCKAFENKDQDAKYYHYLDAETDHVPEHLFYKVDKVRELMREYGAEKPIVFTEIGWSTFQKENCAPGGGWTNDPVTEEQQANFLARTYLISALCGVENVFWYAFQDDGVQDAEQTASVNSERCFGIVDWYGNPKPAYYAYYQLGKLLEHAEVVKRIDTLSHPNYGAVFYDREKDLYLTALWNNSGNGASVSMTTAEESILRLDRDGNAAYISPEEIEIGSAPIYLYTRDEPIFEEK